MDEIEIRSCAREAEAGGKRPVAALLFLIMGVSGILSLLYSLEGVVFSEWLILTITAALCSGIWHTMPDLTMRIGKTKSFFILLTAAVVCCGMEIFFVGDLLLDQTLHIVRCFIGGGNMASMSITELAVLLTVIFSFFIAFFELFLRRHSVLFLMTMALLLLSPFIGIDLGMGTVILLFVFQMSFWVYQTAGKKRKKIALGGVRQHYLGAKSGLAAVLFVLGLFLCVYPFTSAHIEKFYDMAYMAEGQIKNSMNRFSKEDEDPLNGGKIEAGNNYQTGNDALRLAAERKPSETLYLRGFIGGEYKDGSWALADEKQSFVMIGQQLSARSDSYVIRNAFEDMYFKLNQIGHNSDYEMENENGIEIRNLNNFYKNSYMPYYSQEWQEAGEMLKGNSYGYRFYEQKDVKIAWENVPSDFQWYKEVQDFYMQEAQVDYTQAPLQSVPRLSALCKNYPLESLNEISAFILYTMHTNARYTLTPGCMPMNQEIVEYFLFDNGKGYCQHFAATAALMYRLYGIPARYATGYVALPSDFQMQRDGSWRAVITDERAHAWVEIFLEDYGWTPVDVTPTLEGDSIASYPGFDHAVYEQIVEEHGWNQDNPILHAKSSDSQGSAAQRQKKSLSIQVDQKKLQKIYLIVIICLICLIPLLIELRRRKKQKKLLTVGCRAIFYNLQQMFLFSGILNNYDGMEQDFAVKLNKEMPNVSEEDLKKMQRIVIEAAYSEFMPQPEMEEFVREIYWQIADAVYEKLKWHKKIIFKHWKAFN